MLFLYSIQNKILRFIYIVVYISSYSSLVLIFHWGFSCDSEVKNPPAAQEMWVQSLGHEEPLEKEMATHSNILAWETPWTEETDELQSMGLQRVGHNLDTKQ